MTRFHVLRLQIKLIEGMLTPNFSDNCFSECVGRKAII